jgi:hypothetical protein
MVWHSLRRINTVKRAVLLSGIAVVAVTDVALTSYLTRSDVPQRSITLATADLESERSPGLTQPAPPDLTSDENPIPEDRTAITSTDSGTKRFLRIAADVPDKRIRKTLSYRSQTATYSRPEFDCRTVTYPFIGTSYYVRVTDDVGCLPNNISRSKSDSLIARSLPAGGKFWRESQDIFSNLR